MITETMSMADFRLANKNGHLSDSELHRILEDRQGEQSEIRHNEFEHYSKGPHRNAHFLTRYWGTFVR